MHGSITQLVVHMELTKSKLSLLGKILTEESMFGWKLNECLTQS